MARGNFEEKCSSHYIRSEVVNKLVLDTIREVSEYVKLNEEEFIKKVYRASKEQQEKTSKLLKKRLAKEEKRISEINSLIRKLYEDNVSGKLSNKHFDMMLKDFETEQTALEKSIEQTKDTLRDFEEDSIRADKFIALVKKYTDFSELTTQMINEFVDKILVHEGKWDNYERTQEVEIYLNNGKVLIFSIFDLASKLNRFRSITSTVVILANERLNKVSTVNPTILQDMRNLVLQQIKDVKEDPNKVNQAKQVFQGVNTLINLAKTELEYRKYLDTTDPLNK